jgi:non-heme chloroperoxidase
MRPNATNQQPISSPHSSSMSPAYVEIGHGHRLSVRDWGRGPAVLLMAGWAMDSRLWGETMLAMNAHGLRTIAYDRRGHGRSTDPGRLDYDLLSDDLAAVLEALDLTDVTLVAHSAAAGEAIRYITRRGSSRLRRLILTAATGPFLVNTPENPLGIPEEALGSVIKQLAENLDGWLDENTRPFAPTASERTLQWLQLMVRDASRRALIDLQVAASKADFRNEAANLRLPVTIIHGDRDVSAPLDLTARRYASLIPQAELVIYEGAAHGPMVTHAARLAADIASRVAP